MLWRIGSQNAFLVKRGPVQFSRDPLNVLNVHSRKVGLLRLQLGDGDANLNAALRLRQREGMRRSRFLEGTSYMSLRRIYTARTSTDLMDRLSVFSQLRARRVVSLLSPRRTHSPSAQAPLPRSPSEATSPTASEFGPLSEINKKPASRTQPLTQFHRRTYKSVANIVAKGNRGDLRALAVARASAIRQSQRPVKEAPASKLRGVKAKKAAAAASEEN